MANHPAQNYIKFLLIQEPGRAHAPLVQKLENQGILIPDQNYVELLRLSILAPPDPFNPMDRLHRESVRYLREVGVYEMFHMTPAMVEALSYLSDIRKRMDVERILLARLADKNTIAKLNKKHSWFLTEDGVRLYKHYFWNVPLLSFDEWGRYLYDRSAMYDQYMALLQADPRLAYYHLRLDQTIETKEMVARAAHIAYHTLEEVSLVPGARPDKVKAIGVLGKVINECHQTLSTSDMALSGILKQFERLRITHPESNAPDIKQLAPNGNYTGSGVSPPTVKVEEVN